MVYYVNIVIDRSYTDTTYVYAEVRDAEDHSRKHSTSEIYDSDDYIDEPFDAVEVLGRLLDRIRKKFSIKYTHADRDGCYEHYIVQGVLFDNREDAEKYADKLAEKCREILDKIEDEMLKELLFPEEHK